MQPKSDPAQEPVRIDVDPDSFTLTWGGWTVPWFRTTGVVDYAAATPGPRPQGQPVDHDASTTLKPSYGDPLIVRPDFCSIFYRVGSLLHVAPIRGGRVDLSAAAMVDWATAGGYLDNIRVIEHNLTECNSLPTLDPPLHLVQVEATGRMSVSLLVADTDGSPVIGPLTNDYAPYNSPNEVEFAAQEGLTVAAAMWHKRMGANGDTAGWDLVPPAAALDTLAAAGFTTTGDAAERTGLISAFGGGERQWVPGWYGDTRLLTLARFRAGTDHRDLEYDFHDPGSRRVTVFTRTDAYVMRAPADVETRPHDEAVYLKYGAGGWGETRWADAGTVALQEPVLIDGTLPPADHLVCWAATCRRCDEPLYSFLVGAHDLVPYVHDLFSTTSNTCTAHPTSGRRRPHAPVCRVIAQPEYIDPNHFLGDTIPRA
ncbi:MAG TPA: hypothetical protein VFG15_03365 [Amycolatopsis sp.]|nr:hypothetical protein [Amycolatopsis sp.]